MRTGHINERLLSQIKEVLYKFDNTNSNHDIGDIKIMFTVTKNFAIIDMYRKNKRQTIRYRYNRIDEVFEKRYNILNYVYVDTYTKSKIDKNAMIIKFKRSSVNVYENIQRLLKST